FTDTPRTSIYTLSLHDALPIYRGLVHHVVVVERGQVDQLHRRRGLDHELRRRIAELRGQQGEQRTDPLAARFYQVQRRLGHEREIALHRFAQQLLHPSQTLPHRLGQRLVGNLNTRHTPGQPADRVSRWPAHVTVAFAPPTIALRASTLRHEG